MTPNDWVYDKEGNVFFVQQAVDNLVKVGQYYRLHDEGELFTNFHLQRAVNYTVCELEGYSEGEIDFLINLALDTNDREWFAELSERKKQLEKAM